VPKARSRKAMPGGRGQESKTSGDDHNELPLAPAQEAAGAVSSSPPAQGEGAEVEVIDACAR